MSARPIMPLEEQVIRAAEHVVALRRADRLGALQSCQGSNATASHNVARGAVLAAERVLEASVGHLEAERARKAVAS